MRLQHNHIFSDHVLGDHVLGDRVLGDHLGWGPCIQDCPVLRSTVYLSNITCLVTANRPTDLHANSPKLSDIETISKSTCLVTAPWLGGLQA